MRSLLWLGGGVAALWLAASGSIPGPKSSGTPSTDSGLPVVSSDGTIAAVGHTQCVRGRRASIAPVPLHLVVDVLVVPGERVKKGQILVKLDDDEARADVRLKRALLDGAQSAANEARRFLAKARTKQEILPEQPLHEAELAVNRAEAEERAAKAALDSSQAELRHYRVRAGIEGVVSWLDVYPGLVSRPGTSVWGEIVDLRELDVKCELTPRQAEDDVALGQPVELRLADAERPLPPGRLVFIGSVADRKTGRVPVLVRLHNSDQRLRCGVPVSVRFPVGPAAYAYRN